MRQHLKNLIDKLLTLPDKTQAIAQAIAQEQDPQAKQELIKIKNKYFKGAIIMVLELNKKMQALLTTLNNLTYAADHEHNTTKQNAIITAMLIIQEAYNITK